MNNPPDNPPRQTNTLYIGARTPVLLQTARLQVSNLGCVLSTHPSVTIRAIMDSGSQRTYVTDRVKKVLDMSPRRTECIRIKTFGTSEEQERVCEAVDLGVLTRDGETLRLSALVVPVVCDPVRCQPINVSSDCYDHLTGLKLADAADVDDSLEIDMLIGADFYW